MCRRADRSRLRLASVRAKYEAQMWASAILEAIPGRIGCTLRARLLPATVGQRVRIWNRVHIDNPRNLTVGNDVSINRGSVIHAGGGITIGSDVQIGPGVVIYSQNHRFDDPDRPVIDQGYVRAPVVIEDRCWIAAGAIILPGVTIGAGSVVAAGSVVTRDVPSGSLVAGNPAQVKREL